MNYEPVIDKLESEKIRLGNIKDEKYKNLRAAYWTFSKYCEPCHCNKRNSPDGILEHMFDGPSCCPTCKGLGYLSNGVGEDVTPAMRIILNKITENEQEFNKKIEELNIGVKVIHDLAESLK